MGNARNLLIIPSLLVLLVLVGQGAAETPIQAHATVPFDFWMEGDRLPAGSYQIVQIESISYLLFLSTDGKVVSGAYTIAVDPKPVKDSDAKLIFRIQDGRHYFYGGWGPYGKHVLRTASELAVPSGHERVEIPISFP
jgi:hypothetical protein